MKAIKQLCELHKVKEMYAFGSVLTNEFTNNSDVDLVVDFEPMELQSYADNYYSLKFSLEALFKHPIDLLEQKAIRNPYFKGNINKNSRLIYGH